MRNNSKKITEELCEAENLIFFPKTHEESTFIQRKLMDMGYKWGMGSTEPCYLSETVANGLVLLKGKIYHRGTDHTTDYLICTSRQFNEDYMSSEQTFILEQFNRLAARIEEISKKVDAMYDQVMPQKLDKPGLKKPENGSP